MLQEAHAWERRDLKPGDGKLLSLLLQSEVMGLHGLQSKQLLFPACPASADTSEAGGNGGALL